MIYICHCILNAFTLQIMAPIGGGSAEVGISTAIAAFSELVTVLLFGYYLKKMRLASLLRISAIAFVLKSLGSLLAPSVPAYYGVQILQLAGWGIMCIGVVYYVDRITPDRDRAKAQSWAGLTLTVANVVASVTGGRLLDSCGVPVTVTVGTMIGAVGCLLLFCATSHPKAVQSHSSFQS